MANVERCKKIAGRIASEMGWNFEDALRSVIKNEEEIENIEKQRKAKIEVKKGGNE